MTTINNIDYLNKPDINEMDCAENNDDIENNDNFSLTDSDSDLDESWGEEFRGQQELYDKFYKIRNESVKLVYLYISKDDNLEYIKSDIFSLQTPNIIKKESLANIININCKNRRYKIFSIVRFNIDSEPEDILSSLIDCSDEEFMEEVSYTNDIIFNDTVYTFQDLNTLFILLKEKDNDKSKRLTKSIRPKKHNKTRSLRK
tara:strand:+ start:4296 stop:4901 length:606 start_codon:yes stop_codon:yes gene_type:complete